MEIDGRVAVVTGGGTQTVAGSSGRISFMRADMTVAKDVRRLIASTQPQILINNAGGGGHIPPHFPEAAPNPWGAKLQLNLLAPMLATQLALEPMRKAGGGAVVNVASTSALGSEPYQSPEYGAAKAGLIRFTTALGELDGVRVNCIVPDWIATERLTAAELASTPPPIPLADVAAAVLELIDDDTLNGRALVLRRGEPPRLL